MKQFVVLLDVVVVLISHKVCYVFGFIKFLFSSLQVVECLGYIEPLYD